MEIANEVTQLIHLTEPVDTFTVNQSKVEIDVTSTVERLRKEFPNAFITVTHDEVIMIISRVCEKEDEV